MAIANITNNILVDSGVATSSLLPLSGGTLTGALSGTTATLTGGAQALQLTSASDVYLNVTRGTSILNIGVDASSAFFNTNTGHRFYTNSGTINALTILSNGNVGILNNNPQTLLSVENSGTQNVVSPIITSQSTGTTYAGMYSIRDGAGDQRGLIFQNYTANVGLTEKLRITSGGLVGINTTDIDAQFKIFSNSAVNLMLSTITKAAANIVAQKQGVGYAPLQIDAENQQFLVSGSEQMRIVNAGVLMNTTSVLTAGYLCISVPSNNYNAIVLRDSGTTYSSANYYQVFTNSSNSFAGSISHNTATTIGFNTSSDYRLKEDFKDFNGLDILSNIKFYDFKWKDEDLRMHGVIAHELEPLLPLAVSGIKDAVDKDGNMVAQGVDYSKIVPILGKAIQELEARIKELENK